MNVLLVVNRPFARNVSVIVRLNNEDHQKQLKAFMSNKKFKEAFDLVFSNSEPEQYLDPNKECRIKAPAYTLVEDLIVHQIKTEKVSTV